MKTKKWQAVVMSAFTLIMWTHTIPTGKDINIPASWDPVYGDETKSDCIKSQNRYIDKLITKSPGGATYTMPKIINRIHPSLIGNNRVISLFCFPSDFDPRSRSKK